MKIPVCPSGAGRGLIGRLAFASSDAARLALASELGSSGDNQARHQTGGAGRDRTDDLMLAKHALSQLSYGP